MPRGTLDSVIIKDLECNFLPTPLFFLQTRHELVAAIGSLSLAGVATSDSNTSRTIVIAMFTTKLLQRVYRRGVGVRYQHQHTQTEVEVKRVQEDLAAQGKMLEEIRGG